ncbi:aspartate:alanine exchanger family transporter [Floridanema evergladense]|uniref:Aspartate:alanine exchanger family transporter n=1 Tax=Floridaenema evergladense BLCC-F167 TaxID=3153639 RepID=A0ABV4WVP4_9CYAN
MVLDILIVIKNNPQLLLFVLLALAYLFGKIKIAGLEIGSGCGMLIASTIFGHFGYRLYSGTGDTGFLFFLYAVAFQAGPAFFSVVLGEATKYIALAAIATLVAVILTLIFDLIFNFQVGTAVGLFGGSLTTPPGLAAALEALRSGTVQIPENTTLEQVIKNVNVSYALSYLFGLIVVVLFFRSMPKWLRFDLHEESVKAAKEKNVSEEDKDQPLHSSVLRFRAYAVTNPEVLGKTIAEIEQITQSSVQIFKRNGVLIPIQQEIKLQLSDRLSLASTLEQQEKIHNLLGSEVADLDLLAVKMATYEITVTKSELSGKSVREIGITNLYGCYLNKVTRTGIDLIANPDLKISKGDVLTVSGLQVRLDELVKAIGFVERNANQTDLLTFAGGVIAGFLIGQISIKIGGIAIGLGTAGGLLLMGILLGYLRSIHPTFGRMPSATIWICKELGLLLFLAETGIKAGQGIVPALSSPIGIIIVLCSLVISTAPIIVGYIYGIYILKMNPALLLGALTGAVTCTPAMSAISADARSSIPAVGYAGTYVFAAILCTIAGSLMAGL